MVLFMTTGQSMVHYQSNFVISVIFEPPGVFVWLKNNTKFIKRRNAVRRLQTSWRNR